eukprot:GILI01031075.1.p1 GENE.GILI01031075.1~~GILI01031075.1.p1  ORF type:complete len:100 (+),score=5.88 GILI01031075.1:37-300(+)
MVSEHDNIVAWQRRLTAARAMSVKLSPAASTTVSVACARAKAPALSSAIIEVPFPTPTDPPASSSACCFKRHEAAQRPPFFKYVRSR